MFDKDELMLISECILKELENMHQATKLVTGEGSVSAIQKDMEKLIMLNDKVCSLADKD